MSDTYTQTPPLGSSAADLISTQKGASLTLGKLTQALSNALPSATASSSPVGTGINTLGTTGVSVVAANPTRHGIVFHNPSTAVLVYVYPSTLATAPTLSAPGGAFLLATVAPGNTLLFPSVMFSNVNCGFSAFANTGTTGPLTIVEFL